MNKLVIAIFLSFLILKSFGQNSLEKTSLYYQSSGDGPKVEVLLKTERKDMGGAYLKAQIEQFLINGFTYNGHYYTGDELSAYGITFPIIADHASIDITGTAYWSVQGRNESKVVSFVSVAHFSDWTHVQFTQGFNDFVNELYKDVEGKAGIMWQKNGQYKDIKMTRIGSCKKIDELSYEIKQIAGKLEKQAKVQDLIDKANEHYNAYVSQQAIEEYDKALKYLNEAQQIDPDNQELKGLVSEIDNKRTQVDANIKKLEQEKISREAQEESTVVKEIESNYNKLTYAQNYSEKYKGKDLYSSNETNSNNFESELRKQEERNRIKKQAIEEVGKELTNYLVDVASVIEQRNSEKEKRREEQRQKEKDLRKRELEASKERKEQEKEIRGLERNMVNDYLESIEENICESINNNYVSAISYVSDNKIANETYYSPSTKPVYGFILESFELEANYYDPPAERKDYQFSSIPIIHVSLNHTEVFQINPEEDGLYPLQMDILADYILNTDIKKVYHTDKYKYKIDNEFKLLYYKYEDKISTSSRHAVQLMVFNSKEEARANLSFLLNNLKKDTYTLKKNLEVNRLPYLFINTKGTAKPKNATPYGIGAKYIVYDSKLIGSLYSWFNGRLYADYKIKSQKTDKNYYAPDTKNVETYQNFRQFKFINGISYIKNNRSIAVTEEQWRKDAYYNEHKYFVNTDTEGKIGETNRTLYIKIIAEMWMGDHIKAREHMNQYFTKYEKYKTTTAYRTLKSLERNYLNEDIFYEKALEKYNMFYYNGYLNKYQGGLYSAEMEKKREEKFNYEKAKACSPYDASTLIKYINLDYHSSDERLKEISDKLNNYNVNYNIGNKSYWTGFYTFKHEGIYYDVFTEMLRSTKNRSYGTIEEFVIPKGWEAPTKPQLNSMYKWTQSNFSEKLQYSFYISQYYGSWESTFLWGLPKETAEKFKIYYASPDRFGSTSSSSAALKPMRVSSKKEESKLSNRLLDDSFEYANTGWAQTSNKEGNTSIKDGVYTIQSKCGFYRTWLNMNLDLSRDFIISTSIKYIRGPENQFHGIFISNEDQSEQTAFAINNRGYYLIVSNENEVIKKRVNTKSSVVLIGEQKENVLTIKRKGDELFFYINGAYWKFPVAEFNLSGNKLGFYVVDKQTVEVDFINVKYLD